MHIARIAVGALDAPWASPDTWMEVFWLADRRWAGPQGFLMMFGAQRRLRGSWIMTLFCVLSCLALLTPGFLSLAYGTTFDDVERQVTVSGVSVVDVNLLGHRSNKNLQNDAGKHIWSRGVAPAVQFPDNIYAEHYVSTSTTGGSWLITGSANKTRMFLVGVRVAGGCEYLPESNSTFQERCTEAFGNETSLFRESPVKRV